MPRLGRSKSVAEFTRQRDRLLEATSVAPRRLGKPRARCVALAVDPATFRTPMAYKVEPWRLDADDQARGAMVRRRVEQTEGSMPESEVEMEVRAVIDGYHRGTPGGRCQEAGCASFRPPWLNTYRQRSPRNGGPRINCWRTSARPCRSEKVQVGVEIGDVAVHVLGDVAWAEGTGKFTNGQGGERAVRTTGVLVREGGAWRAVQSHASIGVPNEEMFNHTEVVQAPEDSVPHAPPTGIVGEGGDSSC